VTFIPHLLWLTVLLPALTLPGCATTEEQRFPLDYLSGIEASSRLDTAREALPAYQRMGSELERRGQFADASIAYFNAGISARVLGRLQQALEADQKAVEMAERAGKPFQLSQALIGLGFTYISLNAPRQAIPVFERSSRLARESRNPQAEARSQDGLGLAYRRLGKLDQAVDHQTKAVAILEGAIPVLTMEWRRLGVQGQRRLANLERNYGETLVGLGWNHYALRQWDRAREAFQKALDVGKGIRLPHVVASAHLGLGTVASRQRDFPTAVIHLEEALRLNPRPAFVASTQATLGRVYRGMGKLPEAEEALTKAVAGYEELRSLLESETLRETFFEDKAETYEFLVLTLLERGKTPEAFDASERARARAFLDLLGNRVTLSRGRSQSLIAEERALRERISALKAQPEDSPALRRELELAREGYQAFLQRVRQMDREQASLMTVEPLNLKEVQDLLPEGSILLEYFVTGQGRTILWIVERGAVSVVTLRIGRQGVAQRVQAFRNLIATRGGVADAQRMAQALFNQFVLLGLRGRTPRELLIVPHDALHYLPFQALMPAPDRYLIQEAPLYYYSSASLMQFTREKAQGGSPVPFAVGNPDLKDPTLNLRYAEREARGVADLFPGGVVLTRQEATKAKGREHSARHNVLHFATHAELDEADPMGSSLLFTPDRGDDGRLEVQEIFGLDLNASLVVLSACETALGTLSRGDELTGLTRAFIYAGTPSVITTLWKVNDRASYELMGEFYRQLKAGRDKAEALRQAQLATLAKYPHPYYWAAYQLTGEPR
jgi:CHAT domain-containing protein/Flp pilus assembly protein TadD